MRKRVYPTVAACLGAMQTRALLMYIPPSNLTKKSIPEIVEILKQVAIMVKMDYRCPGNEVVEMWFKMLVRI